MNTALLGEAVSSCVMGVRVKAQYCHLEGKELLALKAFSF